MHPPLAGIICRTESGGIVVRPAWSLTPVAVDLTPPLAGIICRTESGGIFCPSDWTETGTPRVRVREGRNRRKSGSRVVRVVTDWPADAFNDWNLDDVADWFVRGRSLKGPDRL